MSEKFTVKAQSSLSSAVEIAREMGHSYVGSEHLLLGILSVSDCVAARIMSKSGVISAHVRREVENISGLGTYGYITSKDMTPGCKRIIEQASIEYEARGQRYIGTEHILYAILYDKSCVAYKILEILCIDIGEIKSTLEGYFSTLPDKNAQEVSDPLSKDKKSSKMLSAYGRDMTREATEGKFDRITGRDEESLRIIQILSRRTKNNPCLIGEAGVGKTAIVEGIAQRISDGDIPDNLRGYRLYSIDIGSMIAGAKYRGEFEERFKGLISEVRKNTNVILFIDEIHTIVGAGAAEGALDAANIIKPILARGELKIIGATTVSEYKRHIEKDSALERRFQPVYVSEPSVESAIEIIEGIIPRYESHHGVKIPRETVIAAVNLSKRYISNRYLPDKAIDLLDESASRIKILDNIHERRSLKDHFADLDNEKNQALIEGDLERVSALREEEGIPKQSSNTEIILTREDIARTLSMWTGISLSHILSSEKEKLYSLSKKLNKSIIGQEDAVSRVSRTLLRSRSGIRDTTKPIASFLFAGPTGVGKTQLCKELSFELFGDYESIIRLDMSEYMERHSVSKLIGSPPGYIGYDDSGYLTEKVRRKPYSIVLFDEIEKAHSDIYNLLLQILDEGTLKDSHGISVDFKNTIIIMTSNVGGNDTGAVTVGFGSRLAEDKNNRADNVRDKIKRHFPSEFLNRIDGIIVFDALDDESIRKITVKMLDESCDKISNGGINIKYSDDVIDHLINAKRNKEYGAREIRRVVTTLFEDEYIDGFYNNKFIAGDTVFAYVDNGKIVFEKI